MESLNIIHSLYDRTIYFQFDPLLSPISMPLIILQASNDPIHYLKNQTCRLIRFRCPHHVAVVHYKLGMCILSKNEERTTRFHESHLKSRNGQSEAWSPEIRLPMPMSDVYHSPCLRSQVDLTFCIAVKGYRLPRVPVPRIRQFLIRFFEFTDTTIRSWFRPRLVYSFRQSSLLLYYA